MLALKAGERVVTEVQWEDKDDGGKRCMLDQDYLMCPLPYLVPSLTPL